MAEMTEAPLVADAAPDLGGLKILVIDDSKTIRRTAETLLTKEGCTVYTAVDGFDALAKIADHNPDEAFWNSVGGAIYEFHQAGVYHADMNAYNVQIDSDGLLWMLDFDKGGLRVPGTWQQKTLSRLHRSLHKIVGLDPTLHFREANWEQLLEGYFNASRSA